AATVQNLVLKSRAVAELAIADEDIAQLPSLRGQADPAATVLKGLAVRAESADPAVLHVSYRGRQSDDCPAILNAVLEAYRHMITSLRAGSAEESWQRITRAKNDILTELRQREAERQVFRDQATWGAQAKPVFQVEQQRLADLQMRADGLAKHTVR